MIEQNFGHKELHEVVLRAKTPMQFGDRYIEADEPVLYFDNVQMATVTEQSRPVFARGGFGNLPRVIWNDRSEVQFQMVEGVMSSIGMGILFSSNVLTEQSKQPLYIPMKEGPLSPIGMKERIVNGEEKQFPYIQLRHEPIFYPTRKTFIFEYDRNLVQKKLYGWYFTVEDGFGNLHDCIGLSEDKKLTKPAEKGREYVIDYYYKYEDEATLYSVQKDRFNGLFTLEGKFYSKDENEGINYTNVLFMPKVRIVSSINLRLGERADPTVSTFNIIGLPETVGDQENLIMEITRLGEPVDADI